MPRASKKEYVLRINLKNRADVRRFCEVHVKGWDTYVFQPRKGESVKVSYHESGQVHLKIGNSDAMFKRFHDSPMFLQDEEEIWSKSFENFNGLLPYNGEAADNVVEIDVPPLPYTDSITFAQVIVGRNFDPKGWEMDSVLQTTIKQEIFKPDASVSGLSVAVRVLKLSHAS
jgi:hypothetical protein